MPEYLIDVALMASLRVQAPDEAQAQQMVAEALDCASGNLGAWPDGSPILCECSVDGEMHTIAIDDVFTEGH